MCDKLGSTTGGRTHRCENKVIASFREDVKRMKIQLVRVSTARLAGKKENEKRSKV